MESQHLISFVIPAYNAENTLEDCVKSIVSYEDNRLEIIIVENGSTDNTYQLARKMSNDDRRIRTLQSEIGVSNARNLGIKKALGTWIVFVDADDCILEEKMNLLIRDAETKDADIILYGHRAGKKIHWVSKDQNNEVFTGERIETARIRMLENPTRYMQVWSKLFRRRLLVDGQVYFDARLRLSEDSDFTFRCSRLCRKIEFSPDCIYQYSLNPASTMHMIDGAKVYDYTNAMQLTAQAAQIESEAIKKAFQKYILMHLNILMVRDIFNCLNHNKLSIKYSNMRCVTELPIFEKAIMQITLFECKNLRMLPILLLKMKMRHCASLIFMIRARQNFASENKTS